MIRNRLEDIGRILEKMEHILDDELFDKIRNHNRREDHDVDEDGVDIIKIPVFRLDQIYDQMCDILVIARGHDDLNVNLEDEKE